VGGIVAGGHARCGKKFHSFKDPKRRYHQGFEPHLRSHQSLRLILEKNGLHYPRRCALIGGTPERFTALESGRVDAVILAAPLSFKALDLGFSKIGDVFEFVTHYQHSALVVKKSWARDNADTVHRVLRALVRSFQWLHQRREEAVSLISSELNLERRYAEAGWEEYARSKAWPLKEIDIEGVETQIKIWAQEKGRFFLHGPAAT
jgi:ABC-type nitrate/sulfonate/bicarbonate transport system substrate-binding protein